ncbi:MAG: iron-sulfur cluster assembly protein [Chthoniobacteraceae bacterium]
MSTDGTITLTREITAIKIPEGAERILPVGTNVVITQELGGTFTVMAPDFGGLFRIQNRDADALGREAIEHVAADGVFEIERVWEQLKQVYDPEIPVNIVDLGLIYDVDVADDESGKGKRVEVKMTLTAPGCGMGPTIAADAQQRILTLPGVADANVMVVWDPQWAPTMISAAGKEKLGME